jgi:pilus assembly protein CpaB
MKWLTVGLMALGTVAATGTAVLVASLQAGSAGEGPATRDVNVLVAARDLSPMAVLGQSDVVTRTVGDGVAPPDTFRDPLQVVGKVLTTPLQAGQPFTQGSFASDGSASRLAAALPPGRRAVTINLSDPLGSEYLLYPGCLVDVLATMRFAQDGGEQPVTVTLLQGVSVLAVGDRTIVSPEPATPEPVQAPRDGARPAVTLLLDGRQAEALKLAMEEGRVSLVLRNPADVAHQAAGGTDMAALSTGLSRAAEPAPTPGADAYPPPAHNPLKRTWDTVVLRGAERQDLTFELPASGQP